MNLYVIKPKNETNILYECEKVYVYANDEDEALNMAIEHTMHHERICENNIVKFVPTYSIFEDGNGIVELIDPDKPMILTSEYKML